MQDFISLSSLVPEIKVKVHGCDVSSFVRAYVQEKMPKYIVDHIEIFANGHATVTLKKKKESE